MSLSHTQYTDFFIAQPSEIAAVQSFDDLVVLVERTGLSVGGVGFTPTRMVALDRVLIDTAPNPLQQIAISHSMSVQLYQLTTESCHSLVQAQYEAMLEGAVTWAESVVWQDIAINPFDLAGFLVSLQHLCQVAQQQNAGVYLLVSADADWKPQSNDTA